MIPLRRTLPLTAALFVLWVVLSEKFDAFHLLVGLASAHGISLGTRRLFRLPPAIGPEGVHPFAAIPWLGHLWYVPWLAWQVVLSSLQVAYVVLHPRMPISPCVVRFKTALPHTLARLTLANSITLTPGTVTLDVEDEDFIVHALIEASAEGLDPKAGEAPMHDRVARLYQRSKAPERTGATS